MVLSRISIRNGYSIVFVHSFRPDVNPIAYEYMERSFGSYDPDNDDRILPTIWRSRFNVIGSGEQCDQLENLIENCNLTNDDLALILQTLELK